MVSLGKTNVMVSRTPYSHMKKYPFQFQGVTIRVVHSYVYQGIIFSRPNLLPHQLEHNQHKEMSLE